MTSKTAYTLLIPAGNRLEGSTGLLSEETPLENTIAPRRGAPGDGPGGDAVRASGRLITRRTLSSSARSAGVALAAQPRVTIYPVPLRTKYTLRPRSPLLVLTNCISYISGALAGPEA